MCLILLTHTLLLIFVDWMVMAEGQKSFSSAVKVEAVSQDEKLPPEAPLQPSLKERTKTHMKETRRDKAQQNVEINAVKLPEGCKETPQNEHAVSLHTKRILDSLLNNDMLQFRLELEIFNVMCRESGDDHSFQYQLSQNITVNGLEEILENTRKRFLKGEGYQNPRGLNPFLIILDRCCTTSNAVKRVMSFPGIISLLKDFINIYMMSFADDNFFVADTWLSVWKHISCIGSPWEVYGIS